MTNRGAEVAKWGAQSTRARPGRCCNAARCACSTYGRGSSGAPPGAIPVSLARHVLKPEGEGALYLCQHAVRSKLTLRAGAAEVAGGFVAWQRAELPVERPD